MSNHIWVNSTDAAIDEKLGLYAVKFAYRVIPSGAETKMNVLSYALTFMPDEVRSFALPVVKRNCKEVQDCSYEVTFECEGHFNPESAEGEEFVLDGTTADEKIEAHPEIQMLVAKYKEPGKNTLDTAMEQGQIIFPMELEVNGQKLPNPMHGIRSYLAPGCIWTKTWVAVRFPSDLARQLGCIGYPPVGKRGQQAPALLGPEWIMVRLTATWRGNIWRISESWMNSGRGGFPPDVYRRSA